MLEEQPAVFAVLDTNDFLEHRRFTEVPWPELVSASAVVLVVPWQVVSELDSNKTNNRSATKRERARELLPLIEHYAQLSGGAEVRSGVTMQFFSANVEDICRKHDLTPTSPDQVIVASALALKDRYQGGSVVLVTGDTGMRMTARRVGLTVVAMPEDLRLPQALDDEERQRREIERELKRYQSRKPAFDIGWAAGGSVLQASVSPVKAASTQEIEARVATRLQRIHLPQSHRVLNNSTAENPAYRDALSRIESFRSKYGEYVTKSEAFRLRDSLTIECAVSLTNQGTKPASDVRLRVTFPTFVTVLDRRTRSPIEPVAPSFGGGGLGSLSDGSHVPQIPVFNPPLVTAAVQNIRSWVEDDKRTVVLRVNKLHQSYNASTDPFFVLFGSPDEVQSFSPGYHLVADDLLEPLEGKLSIVVSRAAGV